MVERRRAGDRVTAVIVQPMFFPWRGQFDLQARADIVIILDTVQWVKGSWYNRNLIAAESGPQWITVPVNTPSLDSHFLDVTVDNKATIWRRKIIKSIAQNYGKAPYFDEYFESFCRLIEMPWIRMASLAEASLRFGFTALERNVLHVRASELRVEAEDPTDRIIALCQAAGADRYLSGPAAMEYIGDGEMFRRAGIELEWMQYDYPSYPQVIRSVERELSILDLLFNTGPDAGGYIWPRHGT